MYVKDGCLKIPSIIKSKTVMRRCFKVLIRLHNSAEKHFGGLWGEGELTGRKNGATLYAGSSLSPKGPSFSVIYFNEKHLYYLKIELYLALLNLMQRWYQISLPKESLEGPYVCDVSVQLPLIKLWHSSETHSFLLLVCLMYWEDVWPAMSILLLITSS